MAPKSSPSTTKTTRTPRKRKAASPVDEAEKAVTQDDFGAGLDEVAAAAAPATPPKRRRPARKKPEAAATPVAPADDFGADLDLPKPSTPAPRAARDSARDRARDAARDAVRDAARDAARDSGSTAAESAKAASESNVNIASEARTSETQGSEAQGSDNQGREDRASEGQSPSGEATPRPGHERGRDRNQSEDGGRRRRRRKRGGRNEPNNRQPQAGQPNSGASSQQGGGQQGGGHPGGSQQTSNHQGGGSQGRDGGGRRNKGRGRDRNQDRNQDRSQRGGGPPQGRRLTKFEQNAPPGAPAVTSGTVEGVLELHPKGYGFLRSPLNDYGAQEIDPFVSSSYVEKYKLREGVLIKGDVGPGTRGQGPRVLEISSIDGRPPEEFEKIKHFDNLTAINPFQQIQLETGPTPITMRVMDLLTPLGKGQRALIVAPPRSGKTMLLQDIAESVSQNHPEIHLIVLLIDERPEEVTDMRRNVKGDVIASSMDRDVESHVRISQLVIERGKRLAESGKDCLILMDSVTRCARAFNKWIGGGRESKIGTGGLDVRALEIPRKMFGTARLFDEGGSLTVCATALIDTGSRMDEAIFQEFKGTGNMELVLSRDLAERRVWPAIDISKSGTRREEKILDPELLEEITMLRRSLASLSSLEAMETLTRTLAKFPSNREFLKKIRSVL